MAKSIDLSNLSKPVSPPAPVAAKPMNVPPPAKPTPGVTGSPPLPVGRLVSVPSLTALEKRDLASIGWSEGDPIPGNMAQLLAEAREAALRDAASAPPPIDPATPPLQVTTIQDTALNPEQRAKLHANIQNALATEQLRREQAAQQARIGRLPPSVAAAAQAAQQASRSPAMPAIQVENDLPVRAGSVRTALPQPQPAARPDNLVAERQAFAERQQREQEEFEKAMVAQQARIEAQQAEAAAAVTATTPTLNSVDETPNNTVPDMGISAALTHCPHCNWELSQDDIPEPEYADKMAFLQSMILGDKPFSKTYPLLGGHLRLTFRTLTSRELDMIYRQVSIEQRTGKLDNVYASHEKLQRYRLYLSLAEVVSTGTMGVHYVAPEGFTPETSPNVTSFWQLPPLNGPEDTGLQYVEEYLTATVLKTENITRLAAINCQRFNRLVAKLEAMDTNSDFWQPTGVQS